MAKAQVRSAVDGDYHWDTSPILGSDEFRSLRTHAHDFAAAAWRALNSVSCLLLKSRSQRRPSPRLSASRGPPFTALSRQGGYAHILKGYFYTNLVGPPSRDDWSVENQVRLTPWQASASLPAPGHSSRRAPANSSPHKSGSSISACVPKTFALGQWARVRNPAKSWLLNAAKGVGRPAS